MSVPNTNDIIWQALFEKALREHPELTAQGIGVEPGGDFKAERLKLEASIDSFKFCYPAMLQEARGESETFYLQDSRTTSIQLSEQMNFPIPEGVLFLAAFAVGYEICEHVGNTSATFEPIPE